VRLALDGTVRRFDAGRTLLGGAPLRVLRLTPAGARLVDAWGDGEPVTTGRQLADRLVDGGLAHPRHEHGPYAAKDVTAVIPVHGPDPGELRSLLTRTGITTVVVDDASPTPLPHSTIRHERARGPAGARNAGASRATTPLIAFLDADCRPSEGWLDPLLPHFADPGVVAVAPRIRSTAGTGLLARYEQARSPLDLGPLPAVVRPGGRVSYLPTAALVIRRETLCGIGGFDELLRYGEDVDLIWRLVALGHRVRYEPAGTVEHAPRPGLAQWLRQRYHYGTSAAPLADRHGRAVAPVRVSKWSAAAWALAAVGKPLSGALTAGTTAALLPRKLTRTGIPTKDALALAARGHLYAGRWLAGATVRAWWPLAALAATRGRPARRTLAAAALLPYALDWRQTDRGIPLAAYLALRLADDLSYGAGVWAGCVRHRSPRALLPDLADWPGRAGVQQA
jgi:mycofactocin glycosyltransferase